MGVGYSVCVFISCDNCGKTCYDKLLDKTPVSAPWVELIEQNEWDVIEKRLLCRACQFKEKKGGE